MKCVPLWKITDHGGLNYSIRALAEALHLLCDGLYCRRSNIIFLRRPFREASKVCERIRVGVFTSSSLRAALRFQEAFVVGSLGTVECFNEIQLHYLVFDVTLAGLTR